MDANGDEPALEVVVEPAVVEPVEEVVGGVGMTGRVGAVPPDDGCHGFGNGDVFSVPG